MNRQSIANTITLLLLGSILVNADIDIPGQTDIPKEPGSNGASRSFDFGLGIAGSGSFGVGGRFGTNGIKNKLVGMTEDERRSKPQSPTTLTGGPA